LGLRQPHQAGIGDTFVRQAQVLGDDCAAVIQPGVEQCEDFVGAGLFLLIE
jgi:hypothetical protein